MPCVGTRYGHTHRMCWWLPWRCSMCLLHLDTEMSFAALDQLALNSLGNTNKLALWPGDPFPRCLRSYNLVLKTPLVGFVLVSVTTLRHTLRRGVFGLCSVQTCRIHSCLALCVLALRLAVSEKWNLHDVSHYYSLPWVGGCSVNLRRGRPSPTALGPF